MSVTTITKDNFEQEVMRSEKPVLIDFWASWCGPCRMLSPVVDEIAEETAEIKVCKVNVDNETVLAEKFGIQSIPALIFIKNGKTVGTSIGFKPKQEILQMIEGAE